VAAATPSRPHGVTVWFTGLPSAGKTTVANLVAERLGTLGHPVEVLDGDVVRTHLSRGLGFSRADRDENIRRIGYVAGLLTGHGVTVLVSAISPYRAVRDEVRAAVERVGGFVEVHVATDLATCQARDVKGLYAKQARGELKGLTGVDDPYEPPLAPELVLDTAGEPPEASATRVLTLLEQRVTPTDGWAPNREGGRPRDGGRTAVHTPHPHGPDPHGGRLVERLVPPDRAEDLAAEANRLPAVALDVPSRTSSAWPWGRSRP
jgi:adenylylsulfate kinase